MPEVVDLSRARRMVDLEERVNLLENNFLVQAQLFDRFMTEMENRIRIVESALRVAEQKAGA